MLCDICHNREAVLFYSLIINNQKTELRLCEVCATKKGLIPSGNALELKDFISLVSSDTDVDKLKCSRCGLTYKEFIALTKFGCPDCYKAFDKELHTLFQRLHGSEKYMGKTINIGDTHKGLKLFELNRRLSKAIESESYEEAAHIRDELKKLKSEFTSQEVITSQDED